MNKEFYAAMTNNILRFWQSMKNDDPFDPFFEAAPVMMHSIDENGVLVQVSRFWANKLGYEPAEMLGRKSVEFLTDDSRAYAREVVLPEFFRKGAVTNVAYDFVRRDGKILPVLMSAMAHYDAEGAYVRSLAVLFDNTEAKRNAAELLEQQRMDAIGGLVGGVAHDFNNLLAVIQGNLEFLRSNPDDPDRSEFIESALGATIRGASLTQQLLSFGRKSHLSPSLLDINDTVAGADRMVRRLFPSNIQVETVAGGGLWKAHVDPAYLETALLNILNNARDAMPDGGRITLETRNVRINESYLDSRNEEIKPGRYVMLAVSDTGEGMPNEILMRAFEPFFSTKPVGKGSGLGLSMVFGFMRQSGGAIRGYSEIGVGTTFRMYFPAVSAEPMSLKGADQFIASSGRGKTVLLAEDEDKVRKVFARQLAREGYEVVECATGDMALLKIREGLKPDLLVTDIVMPGSLQGPELASLIREDMPDLPVLFVSGYPTEAAIHSNGLRPEDKHLIKPIGQEEFLKVVTGMFGRQNFDELD